MNTRDVERAIIANRPGEPFVLVEISPPDISGLSTLDWQADTDPPTWADVTAWVPALQNQPATADDHRAASEKIISEKLAQVPIPVGEIGTILQNLLTQAAAAIPFFEKYAHDPSMTAAQWVDFHALPWDATAPQTDDWAGDGTATSWGLSATLDQAQAFTLTVGGAAATCAIATSSAGATTQYVLVETSGAWSLECGTDPAPASGAAISLAYQKIFPASKERLLYDVVRSLAALMRYLTGDLPTS